MQMRHGCEGIRKTDAFNVLERIRPPKGFQTPVRYLLNHCSLSSFLARSSVDTSNLLRNHAGYQMQIIMLCSEIPENTSSKVIASADRSYQRMNQKKNTWYFVLPFLSLDFIVHVCYWLWKPIDLGGEEGPTYQLFRVEWSPKLT